MCLFLAEEVDPPLVKPLEMVLMVPRREGLARVMSAPVLAWWVGCGVCHDERHVEDVCGRIGGWRVREEEEWSSLQMKRRKWPARTSSSILSWSLCILL